MAFKEVLLLPSLWDIAQFWLIADPWIYFTGASTGLLLWGLLLFWNAKIRLPQQSFVRPALLWLRSRDKLQVLLAYLPCAVARHTKELCSKLPDLPVCTPKISLMSFIKPWMLTSAHADYKWLFISKPTNTTEKDIYIYFSS